MTIARKRFIETKADHYNAERCYTYINDWLKTGFPFQPWSGHFLLCVGWRRGWGARCTRKDSMDLLFYLCTKRKKVELRRSLTCSQSRKIGKWNLFCNPSYWQHTYFFLVKWYSTLSSWLINYGFSYSWATGLVIILVLWLAIWNSEAQKHYLGKDNGWSIEWLKYSR